MKNLVKAIMAVMIIGTALFTVGCKKEKKAEVETSHATNVTSSTATVGGIVTFDGNSTVSERGVCWGKETNPDVGVNHLVGGSGTGSFTCELTGLQPATTYYVRAYAINTVGVSYGTQVSFTTLTSSGGGNGGNNGGGNGGGTSGDLPTVVTNTVSNITENMAVCIGNVTDDGGASVTSRGVCWSTTQNPTTNNSYVSAGTGTGSFTCEITGLTANTTYYVRAFAINEVGTAYGNQIDFTTESLPGTPAGAIDGLFSVDGSKKVYFSKGNLQYIGSASTPYWKFAENQWDCLGTTTGQNSAYQTIDRDLFGWGTSGYNYIYDNYQPWATADAPWAYGPSNITDLQGKSDWGYNAISNGGNTENQWRTPTKEEWDYMLNFRPTQSGIRFAKATIIKINGNKSVKGLIILPNNWSTSYYSLNSTNTTSSDYSSNQISVSDWINKFEANGAVFLPTAGRRIETSVGGMDEYGYYWSSTCSGQYSAVELNYGDSFMDIAAWYENRSYGYAVRLIQEMK